MKNLSLINKVFFLINNIFMLLLMFSFALPYIKPSSIATAPVIGLLTPALILVNILFVLYWIVFGFKKQFLLSTTVLIIGYFIAPPIYKIFSNSKNIDTENKLSILSYNVRKFNMYNWIDDDNITKEIADFINKEKPDVVSFQEFKEHDDFKIDYKYSYHHNNYVKHKKTYVYPSGLAFFSKYPIIKNGVISFTKFSSSIIYVDILKNKDTIRVYNFHLESLGVNPNQEYFGHQDSEGLVKKLRNSFKKQQEEIDKLKAHLETSKIPTIVTGDMNNTPYSWAYRNLKGDFSDTFLEAGKGFGKTYNFKGFPLRIDYIFADPSFDVLQHKNYNVKYSDHYPILATFSF